MYNGDWRWRETRRQRGQSSGGKSLYGGDRLNYIIDWPCPVTKGTSLEPNTEVHTKWTGIDVRVELINGDRQFESSLYLLWIIAF